MTTHHKPLLFFDMDGVLVDFQSGIDRLTPEQRMTYQGHYDDCPGIFSLMEPMEGAVEACYELAKVYELYILSTSPWLNPSALNDKLAWIKKYFGGESSENLFYKRIIFAHHKNLINAPESTLIEDRYIRKSGAGEFNGRKIWLDIKGNSASECLPEYRNRVERCSSWKEVVELLTKDFKS